MVTVFNAVYDGGVGDSDDIDVASSEPNTLEAIEPGDTNGASDVEAEAVAAPPADSVLAHGSGEESFEGFDVPEAAAGVDATDGYLEVEAPATQAGSSTEEVFDAADGFNSAAPGLATSSQPLSGSY